MILRLLTLPFRLAGFLFSLVFVVGMLEFFGMLMYLQWRSEAALESLTAGGVTPTEVVNFMLASPDRLLVAGALAFLGFLMVVSGDSGSGVSHGHGGDFDGGGFDGGGGDGGGGE